MRKRLEEMGPGKVNVERMLLAQRRNYRLSRSQMASIKKTVLQPIQELSEENETERSKKSEIMQNSS